MKKRFIIILQGLLAMALLFPSFGCTLRNGKALSSRAFSEKDLNLYTKALSLYGEGRYEEADKALESIASLYPARILKGKALFFAGQYDRAQEDLSRALKQNPASVEARLYLAHLKRYAGKDEEAWDFVESILSDDPYNLRALRIALEHNGGDRELLDQAVEAAREGSFIFIERAQYRWILGDGEGALEDLAAARAIAGPRDSLVSGIEALEQTIQSQLSPTRSSIQQ